ncbi:hypothetical protein ASC77_20385 [Nocardioides sp. Root1257]|uniref:hypothetical protein n=1 Tax=unclassified Nocardioides TaxID=2615069 RepID=UPI0006F6E237|nr:MULTISPECIES: hypothetical protein [unclassified Nocardioides]KQW45139.1 hypothetical protein ASC77_20385 [Nocardioides sp. Root1257]KRC45857.1 hypothetical protein ASE24_14835 [Nocardioides sp. Root224]
MTTLAKAVAAAVTVVLATVGSLLLPVGSAVANDEDAGAFSGTWHHVHWHINAYGGGAGGSCEGSWRDDAGFCQGRAEWRTWHDSYPFNNTTFVRWASQPTRCPDVPGGRDPAVWRHEVHVYAAHVGTGQNSWLCGWVDRGWNTMIVTGGQVRGYDGYFHDIAPSSGKVADREHVQGGPLYVFLDANRERGAVIGLRGWIRY